MPLFVGSLQHVAAGSGAAPNASSAVKTVAISRTRDLLVVRVMAGTSSAALCIVDVTFDATVGDGVHRSAT
jgi:hypothetical protein